MSPGTLSSSCWSTVWRCSYNKHTDLLSTYVDGVLFLPRKFFTKHIFFPLASLAVEIHTSGFSFFGWKRFHNLGQIRRKQCVFGFFFFFLLNLYKNLFWFEKLRFEIFVCFRIDLERLFWYRILGFQLRAKGVRRNRTMRVLLSI